MANGKGNVEIAHGGACPKGYIYDHNKASDTYGTCIPLSSGTLADKEKNMSQGLNWMRKYANQV